MARDVEPITDPPMGSLPLAAARLCNFSTGAAKPLSAHVDWINGPFANALKTARKPWVEVFAYASKSGSAAFNQALSERRRAAVHDLIMKAVPHAGLIKVNMAFGESLSGGAANDNDGYWRAVRVHAFGALPYRREPDPNTPTPVTRPAVGPAWWVDSLNVGGLSVVINVGGGYADGTIGFENIVTGEKPIGAITIAGASLGESAGVDKIGKLAAILSSHPIAKKAVDWVVNGIAAGRQQWPSRAAGPVFAMPGYDNLSSTDFKGTCLAVFATASAGPAGSGLYLIFMGKQESLASFVAWIAGALDTVPFGPSALAANIIYNCHAIAVVPAQSIGFGLSLGVSVNIWPGRIG
jgi:hypothetical protein